MFIKIWHSIGVIALFLLCLATAYEVIVDGQQPPNSRMLLIILLAIQQKPVTKNYN
mgnify:CR=1 FL=1